MCQLLHMQLLLLCSANYVHVDCLRRSEARSSGPISDRAWDVQIMPVSLLAGLGGGGEVGGFGFVKRAVSYPFRAFLCPTRWTLKKREWRLPATWDELMPGRWRPGNLSTLSISSNNLFKPPLWRLFYWSGLNLLNLGGLGYRSGQLPCAKPRRPDCR